MEAELMALASAGASTLVQHMVTDGWNTMRTRMAALFARGSGAAPEEEGAELDRSRALLVADGTEDAEVTGTVEARWRERLRAALVADPALAADLRTILAELGPADPSPGASGGVHNTINGGQQTGPVVQIGRAGDLHIG